jgi:hypothetical protein
MATNSIIKDKGTQMFYYKELFFAITANRFIGLQQNLNKLTSDIYF